MCYQPISLGKCIERNLQRLMYGATTFFFVLATYCSVCSILYLYFNPNQPATSIIMTFISLILAGLGTALGYIAIETFFGKNFESYRLMMIYVYIASIAVLILLLSIVAAGNSRAALADNVAMAVILNVYNKCIVFFNFMAITVVGTDIIKEIRPS